MFGRKLFGNLDLVRQSVIVLDFRKILLIAISLKIKTILVMSVYTREQVAQNNSESKAWIIIDSVVYDITKFAAMHPGGELLLLEYAGKDATGTIPL